MKKIILSFSLLLFLFINPATALAQGVTLGIYPPIMQIDTTPPSNIKSKLNLINQGSESVSLDIQIKPFIPASSNDGQVQVIDSYQNFPDPLLVNRVQIKEGGNSVKSVTLSPNQNKTLDFEITIPENEAKGDYYFTVLFISKPSTNIQSNSVLSSAGVAMNVLMTVGPKGKVSGFISKFSSPLFVDRGPVHFDVMVGNNGENFFASTGNILIENALGQKSGEINLTPVNVLSNSQRTIPDTDFNKKFLIGPYKATLNLKLADGVSFTRSISFFAFPATYAISILIILGIVTFILIRVKKRIN